ncbi:hypothetical protein An02g00930 [Aspergillus niger]|uniref:Uncharacterized protein n=2 Tax=Aspergillus niger TaxID=5061 RepID=A2QBR0_ASPNC|nr:hypothetical protein An02g00930 [Aspergillus niger]CAK96307.1 hypothetical protein An02g00930 [Aspergillus niger]
MEACWSIWGSCPWFDFQDSWGGWPDKGRNMVGLLRLGGAADSLNLIQHMTYPCVLGSLNVRLIGCSQTTCLSKRPTGGLINTHTQ